jgi:hypothetical protein
MGGRVYNDLQTLCIGHGGAHCAVKRADIGGGVCRRFASIDVAKLGGIIVREKHIVMGKVKA